MQLHGCCGRARLPVRDWPIQGSQSAHALLQGMQHLLPLAPQSPARPFGSSLCHHITFQLLNDSSMTEW